MCDVFTPFGVFSWGGDSMDRLATWTVDHSLPWQAPSRERANPLGIDKKEARRAAWALTLAASSDPPSDADFAKAVERLSYATHLDRTAPRASKILDDLRAAGPKGFALAELQERLGDVWATRIARNSDDHCFRTADPYHWSHVENLVAISVERFLVDLDMALCKLKGLASDQLNAATYQDFCAVRTATSKALTRMLLHADAKDFDAALCKLYGQCVPPRVTQAKKRIRQRIAAVVALQRLANASLCAGEGISEVFTQYEHEVRIAALDPPAELVDHLSSAGISLCELAECFREQSNGYLDTDHARAAAPMSAATRLAIVGDWAFRVAPQLAEACASTLTVLSSMVAELPASDAWSGVRVSTEESPDFQTILINEDFRNVSDCPLPDHAPKPDETPVLYVDNESSAHALRVARFLATLHTLGSKGFLRPGIVRADKLTPIFARVRTEQLSTYSAIVAQTLKPLGERCNLPFPEDDPPPRRKRDAQALPVHEGNGDDAPSLDKTSSAVPDLPPPLPPTPQERVGYIQPDVTVGLRQEVKRDHAVLCAILNVLDETSSRSHTFFVRPHTVVAALKQIASEYCSSVTPASLNAVAPELLRKLARKFQALMADAAMASGVKYNSQRNLFGDQRVAGLELRQTARPHFVAFCRGWKHRLERGQDSDVLEWHPSRSTRAHAATAARSHLP